MSCQTALENLSLYLYGELDFTQEEEFESHLSECAACREALARETKWHHSADLEQAGVPLSLLMHCRRDLKESIASMPEPWSARCAGWLEAMGLAPSRWSMQLAMASFLVFLGFGAARMLDRHQIFGPANGVTEAGLAGSLDPASTRIRDIEPSGNNQVRISVDQVNRRIVVGRVDDAQVRQLLLAGARLTQDPGIRADSFDVLKDEAGSDVRDALLDAVEHDPNAGVRLKALSGLRRFANDPAARQTITWVLAHDQNPGVRTQAIDVLVPDNPGGMVNPQLVGQLQELVHSEPNGYVKMRCLRALRDMKASANPY